MSDDRCYFSVIGTTTYDQKICLFSINSATASKIKIERNMYEKESRYRKIEINKRWKEIHLIGLWNHNRTVHHHVQSSMIHII